MTLKDAVFTGSRERVVSEEEFLPALEEASSGLLELRLIVRSGAGREWSRRFVSRLIREVHNLRTVLNDHDAQENRTYSYFMEIVAGIRGFGKVIYILKHLRERFLRSPLRDVRPQGERFLAETVETLRFCGETLRDLFRALEEECAVLGIRLPRAEAVDSDDGSGGPEIRRHLPHNIDEEELAGEGEKVAQIASHFLKAAEDWEALDPGELYSFEEIRDFVRQKLDEEKARHLESTIHSIQSKYDTYIQFTSREARDPSLRFLRSVLSLTLHLAEVITHLVHFYERHENDIRSARTKERLSEIVDKQAVLDRAVNYAFQQAGWFLSEGKAVCQKLIPQYTSIQELAFPIPPDVRLHIRPAALIAAIVTHHGTPVRMRMGKDECDAASVTDVIFLAGTNLDAREAVFRGDERPLRDLKVLFERGLGDDPREELEEVFPYLNRSYR